MSESYQTNITARFTRRRNPAQYEHADAEIIINGGVKDGETEEQAARRLMSVAKGTVLEALTGRAPTASTAPPAEEKTTPEAPAEDPRALAMSKRGLGTVAECADALKQCGGDPKRAAEFLRQSGGDGGSAADVGANTMAPEQGGNTVATAPEPEQEVIPPERPDIPGRAPGGGTVVDAEASGEVTEPRDGTTITGEELRQIASQVAAGLGQAAGPLFVNKVMKDEFGVTRMGAIPEDKRPAFVRALKSGPKS
ncbi:hypothetical protein [uncultured Rhodospira sp.]|uniref:hypothetical protein n=1 Tax=uncultured Rhodospira sp. TaxID=1936189 RepID=UPI002618C4CB|nr:hypothetical protein [uncultured Rhodospira sp.]